MNIYKTPTGELELGDFRARKSQDWVVLTWVINHQCNVGCPYCIGWKDTTPTPTVIDKLGSTAAVVARFERLRDYLKKNIYIVFSGGEPTLIPQLPQLFVELGAKGFILELQTNATTKELGTWLATVPPAYVGQILASYHGWLLDNDLTYQNAYFTNFQEAIRRGHTGVLKVVATPPEIPLLPQKIDWLKSHMGGDAPILPWVFIRNVPTSVHSHGGAYPQAYTEEEKKTLFSTMKYRYTCQQVYCKGAGFFQGMLCDSGHDHSYIDPNGAMFPCYGLGNNQYKIGDLITGQYNFNSSPIVCPRPYCGSVLCGLWYGVHPWDYVPGATKAEAYYCRSGPSIDFNNQP